MNYAEWNPFEFAGHCRGLFFHVDLVRKWEATKVIGAKPMDFIST
jgi:hypothetical protein